MGTLCAIISRDILHVLLLLISAYYSDSTPIKFCHMIGGVLIDTYESDGDSHVSKRIYRGPYIHPRLFFYPSLSFRTTMSPMRTNCPFMSAHALLFQTRTHSKSPRPKIPAMCTKATFPSTRNEIKRRSCPFCEHQRNGAK